MGLRRPILLTCMASAAILALGGYYFASREMAKGAYGGTMLRNYLHDHDMAVLTNDKTPYLILLPARVDNSFVCHDSKLLGFEIKPRCETRSLDNMTAIDRVAGWVRLSPAGSAETYYTSPTYVQIKCKDQYIPYNEFLSQEIKGDLTCYEGLVSRTQ